MSAASEAVLAQKTTKHLPAARVPALDGVRGLAISLVLWCHAMPREFPNHPRLAWIVKLGRFSWSGVDLFFVLSGFLIGGILLDAATSPAYFKTFYIRRAYRILPPYALLLAIALLVERSFGWLPPYLFFLQNFWMAKGSFGIPLLAVTWSLAVEEQFYLSLPLLIRYTPRRVLGAVLGLVVLCAPLLRSLAVHSFAGGTLAAYVLMPCRADALCSGVLIALAYRTPSLWTKVLKRRNYFYVALALVFAVGLYIMLGDFHDIPVDSFGQGYSLIAALYSLLLLSTLLSPTLSRCFSWSPLRFMGVIAYGLYLFHSGFIDVFRWLAAKLFVSNISLAESVASLVSVVVCVGLAALSWQYFEKPLLRRGHRHAY
jgi:peptidoglycan/LPS O-acetylase OafA/YrhL